MTESGVHSTPAEPLFDAREMTQLRRDDGDASRVIGTMLTAFFFYSLVIVIGVSGFTAWAMSYQKQRFDEPAAAPAHGHSAGHADGHAADHKHTDSKGHAVEKGHADEKGHEGEKPADH